MSAKKFRDHLRDVLADTLNGEPQTADAIIAKIRPRMKRRKCDRTNESYRCAMSWMCSDPSSPITRRDPVPGAQFRPAGYILRTDVALTVDQAAELRRANAEALSIAEEAMRLIERAHFLADDHAGAALDELRRRYGEAAAGKTDEPETKPEPETP